MNGAELFNKTIDDSGLSVSELSDITGIPEERIEELRKDITKAVGVEIQTLSSALKMSDPLRRNIWFNRNLPLD